MRKNDAVSLDFRITSMAAVTVDSFMKHHQDALSLHHTILLMTLRKRSLENTVGKGENASNQHFLLFPQCFQSYQ